MTTSQWTAGILLCVVTLGLGGCSTPLRGQPREEMARVRYSGDPGTAVVAAFYRALLQDEPVTREQEAAMFVDEGGIRGFLISTGQNKNDPIVLECFRKHKQLFLPRNSKKKVPNISISSIYAVSRVLDQPNNDAVLGTGEVIVIMAEDETAEGSQHHERAITFHLTDGKIDPDAIYLRNYDGPLASDWIRDTMEGPAYHIRTYGDRVASTKEAAADAFLPMLRPTMSRDQIEKWLGPPYKSVGLEENGVSWCLYYVEGGKPLGKRLMSVEYERRDGKWMFVRTSGPHGSGKGGAEKVTHIDSPHPP